MGRYQRICHIHSGARRQAAVEDYIHHVPGAKSIEACDSSPLSPVDRTIGVNLQIGAISAYDRAHEQRLGLATSVAVNIRQQRREVDLIALCGTVRSAIALVEIR